ncbi:hypothetical protein DSECCO2_204320 [anaerobic digester metagenome]
MLSAVVKTAVKGFWYFATNTSLEADALVRVKVPAVRVGDLKYPPMYVNPSGSYAIPCPLSSPEPLSDSAVNGLPSLS